MKRFVIPDVHGCAKTLEKLVCETLDFTRADELYLLGDLIDRGSGSRQVIDFIINLRNEGYHVRSVRGNHEEMFLNACRDRNLFRLWMINGGGETLASFGAEDACDIPIDYRRFCADLPYFIQTDDFIIVHAGLNLDLPNPFLDTETMLWTRHQVGDRDILGGRRIVCGHTPVPQTRIRAGLESDCIMLDNGCVYVGVPGLGSLTALELNSMTLHFQQCLDF